MSANELNETKYDAMVENASPRVKISSTVFKNFIGDVYGVVNQNAGEINGKVSSNDGSANNITLTDFASVKMNRSDIPYQQILRTPGSNVAVGIDLDFGSAVTSNDITVALFRGSNTTGKKIFSIRSGDGASTAMLQIENGEITVLNGLGTKITAGTGSPEGTVTANSGSLYLNRSGGTNTTIYVKRSGTGNTGWFAVA